MVKKNDTIAIIVIVIFLLLALVSFGIWFLVHKVRTHMSVTSSSSNSSSHLTDGD